MAKREYMEAAKTAVIIAQEEQISGECRSVRFILLACTREMIYFKSYFNCSIR